TSSRLMFLPPSLRNGAALQRWLGKSSILLQHASMRKDGGYPRLLALSQYRFDFIRCSLHALRPYDIQPSIRNVDHNLLPIANRCDRPAFERFWAEITDAWTPGSPREPAVRDQ